MSNQKIYTIMVPSADSGDIFMVDAIDHEGGIWLVPHWICNPATGLQSPVRIIRVDCLALLSGRQAMGANYAVPFEKVSTALLEGRAKPAPPIELIESPSIFFPIPGTDPRH